MVEIWKTINIPEISEGYEVSSIGRIRYKESEPYYASYHSSNGYDYASLMLSENTNTGSMFRLYPIDDIIAIAFVPIPQELLSKKIKVKHIDGDTRNVSIDNMIWVEDIEVWVDLNYPDVMGIYEISSWGNIRNSITKEPVMKHTKNGGYKVSHLLLANILPSGRKYNTISFHRLMAWHFCKGKDFGKCVNHINGIPGNDLPKNLEFCTIKENTQHAMLCGLKSHIPFEIVDMVCELLIKYKYSRIVYNMIDHKKYPFLTMNVITAIKNGRYTHVDDGTLSKFHDGKTTTEELDHIRDLLLEHDGDCRKVYGLLDKERCPHITLQMIREIKTNKYSSYARSNKYDLDTLVFKKSPYPCRLTDKQIDELRDLLMKHNGEIQEVFDEFNQNKNIATIDMIKDLKRGKSYLRSNKYDLNKSKCYPFIVKGELL